jgi:hypothetical protein
MVNKINVKILGEGFIDTDSEQIRVKNVYLMKHITKVNNNDLIDNEFALKFYDNNDYYKVKKLGNFSIKLKDNKTLKKCKLLFPKGDIKYLKEFKGIIKQ